MESQSAPGRCTGVRHIMALVVVVVVGSAACSSDADVAVTPEPLPTLRPGLKTVGPLDDDVKQNLDVLLSDPLFLNTGSIPQAGASGDVRVGWVLVDMLRFHQGQREGPALLRALAELTGVRYSPSEGSVPWVRYTDLLLHHEVPAPPGYLEWKKKMYVGFHDRWEPLFDPAADLDWRQVAWGGVLRDGIVALDHPPVIGAADGDWLEDDDIVFGVVAGGDARGYPRRVMDVHEMANDTLGGVRIALSYCTLCGSAIAHVTEGIRGTDEPLELRTSGLLFRSNKLMYDVQTESMWRQFAGQAVTGPLKGTKLRSLPVAVTTWRDWRRAHPATTVTPEEIGGRSYSEEEPSDASEEPVFPVGDIDPRLPPKTVVFGASTPRGVAVAFHAQRARNVLRSGGSVQHRGVHLELVDGGLRAVDARGRSLGGHEAFWFAWSQFHPNTELWTG